MRKSIVFGTWNGEPLKWLVLEEYGNALTLWCKRVVAKMPFADTISAYYDESRVRSFLAEEFYKKAFSDKEKARILLTELDMSEKQTYYGAISDGATAFRRPPISERVYLLSVREIMKTYALTEKEIYREDAEKLWARSPNNDQTVSLIYCGKEILDGKSPYTYVSESYNPFTDTVHSSTVPYFSYTNKEHGVVPAIRIKK